MDRKERGTSHQGVQDQTLGLGNMRVRHPSGRLTISRDQGIHQILVFSHSLISRTTEGSAEVKQPLAFVERMPDCSGKAAIARGISDGRMEEIVSAQIAFFTLRIIRRILGHAQLIEAL